MSRATFKTLPAHCRIVGDPAAPRSDVRTGAPRRERAPTLPTTPEPEEVPATRPAEAKETGGAVAPWLRQYAIATYDFRNDCDRLVWTGIPKDQTNEFIAHCQQFKPTV